VQYIAFGKKKKRLKSAFFLCIDSYWMLTSLL